MPFFPTYVIKQFNWCGYSLFIFPLDNGETLASKDQESNYECVGALEVAFSLSEESKTDLARVNLMEPLSPVRFSCSNFTISLLVRQLD